MTNRDKILLEGSAPGDSFATIGADLRAARIDTGLSIADVAAELRISRDFIRALDKGDFDALPGSAYVAGYLRSYCAVIGLDAVTMISRYQDVRGVGARQQKYSFPIDQPRAERSGAVVASVAVILGLAGYAGWYWSGKPGVDIMTGSTEVAAVSAPSPQIIDPAGDQPVANLTTLEIASVGDDIGDDIGDDDATDAAANADGETATAVAVDAPADPLPLVTTEVETAIVADADIEPSLEATPATVANSVANSETSSETSAETSTVAAAPASAQDTGPALVPAIDTGDRVPDQASAIATPREPSLEITLRATASSWVEIVRNDGEEVMTKLMRDGDTYLIDGGANLYLSTGNAGGLEFLFPDGAVLPAGDVGEILRDLPLKAEGLLASL